jgi:hypothetical protein
MALEAMPLFRHLSDDAFLVFSRKHRFAYEAALLACYRTFFSTGAAYPTPKDVIHVIYDTLGQRPELIGEDEDPTEGLPELVSRGRRRVRFVGEGTETGDRALAFATRLYQGLLRSGWLEEDEWGLRVTVDMPLGPQYVVQRLDTLSSDIAQRFGGLVVHIKASLEIIERLPEECTERERGEAAHALREARVKADEFTRTLRAILSDLRRIRRTLGEAESLKQKMDTYFEEFIGELVLKDFQSLFTYNHPYRYRDRIIDLARQIAYSTVLLDRVGRGYHEIGIGRDLPEAVAAATDDLLSLESAFDVVGEMFERIALFRRSLEVRLRNTVKYAERGERGLVVRSRELVRRMDDLLRRDPERYAGPTVPSTLRPSATPLSQGGFPKPRRARAPLARQALRERPDDPLHALRKRLRAEYLERIAPHPRDVRRFLDDRLAGRHETQARFVELRHVDDFLAFDTLRRWVSTGEIPAEIASAYDFDRLDGPPHDSDWLRCTDFRVRRRMDAATAAAAE